MGYDYLDILSTPLVRAAQDANGSGSAYSRMQKASRRFAENETGFIAAADSFYIASHSESGWPYVQHRGGPKGFLKVLDDQTLGFADFRGNKQYITLGNIGTDDRVALIIVDYPRRARLKILAHMRSVDLASSPELAEELAVPAYKAKVERAFVLQLEAFDWNCPQHITPRFTTEDIEIALAPLHEQMEALEAENAELRRQIAKLDP
jgi:predicted pyridoxine 5'-phosphate oxidase superfamily flavin-nucleotide-binding protein